MFERTLIITPHCDDETIGCGGLIHKLGKEGKEVRILLTGDHSPSKDYDGADYRYLEFIDAMNILIPEESSTPIRVDRFNYPDGELDTVAIKELITRLDTLIYAYRPTAVLFPYASHHQDHQILNKACIAALRPTVDKNFIKLKAMYEYPYLGSWGTEVLPTGRIYIPLTCKELEIKKKALLAYKSQLIKDSRDILDASSIIDFAKVRGREIGEYSAEAYYPLQIIL